MCPDRQVISLYFDNELPSPWKDKLEVHLESCPGCRAVLDSFRGLAEVLRGDFPRGEEPALEAAKERVWEKLSVMDFSEQPKQRRREGAGIRNLMRRSITLPLPAAAAAAALVIVMFLALMGIRQAGTASSSPQQDSIAVIPDHTQMVMDVRETIPMQDMNSIIQYLSSQDNSNIVIIQLPENRRFNRTGEPTLINAIDYSRRNSSR